MAHIIGLLSCENGCSLSRGCLHSETAYFPHFTVTSSIVKEHIQRWGVGSQVYQFSANTVFLKHEAYKHKKADIFWDNNGKNNNILFENKRK